MAARKPTNFAAKNESNSRDHALGRADARCRRIRRREPPSPVRRATLLLRWATGLASVRIEDPQIFRRRVLTLESSGILPVLYQSGCSSSAVLKSPAPKPSPIAAGGAVVTSAASASRDGQGDACTATPHQLFDNKSTLGHCDCM